MRTFILTLLLCSGLSMAGESGYPGSSSSGSSHKLAFRLTGMVLAAGGAYLAYKYDADAGAAHKDYGKSAFTENTVKLRDDVTSRDTRRNVSLGVACFGLLLVVYSF